MAIAREFSERTFDGKVRKFFSHVERVSRRACDDPAGLLDLLAAEPRLNRERLAQFRGVLLPPPLPRAPDVGERPAPPVGSHPAGPARRPPHRPRAAPAPAS